MELNTNERRINAEVESLLEQGKMEFVVKEVSKLYRYQLIKIDDAEKYLTAAEFIKMFDALDPFLKKIEQGRVNEGKTAGNDYIVINRDESYIHEIIAILAKNGHWDGKITEECGWCGTNTTELSGPHLLDFVPGEKMCRNCWEHDRETYLGSLGTDIGEFKASK